MALAYKGWGGPDHAAMPSDTASTLLSPATMDRPIGILPSAIRMSYPDDPSFGNPRDAGRLEMLQDEIDAVLRNKRKARDPKACYACHRRKVKCDRGLPCDSCIKRDHPELCSYERPGKRRRIAIAAPLATVDHDAQSDGADHFAHQGGANVTLPMEQWERMKQELQALRETKSTYHNPPEEMTDQDDADGASASRSDESEREGIHAPSDQMGTIHLGSRSVLAYMIGLGRSKSTQNAARTLLEENILPKLGLDNETASYPFVDLWSTTDPTMQDVSGLCKALPDDQLCHE
jgi:Fungal Zn(2)-Cys(6) binuclear cluster domain